MNDKDLEVTIKTTKGTWYKATFPKTAKVEDVIRAVKQHFDYANNGNYELKLEGSTIQLKPERTLVSEGIKDGDVLIFTDLGGGV
jgi:hypothetical protein